MSDRVPTEAAAAGLRFRLPPRVLRMLTALGLALGGTAFVPKEANACAVCCTPYTYLQFCCYGCINMDFQSLAQQVLQKAAVLKNIAELARQGTEMERELVNDYTILTTLGSQIRQVPSQVTAFGYNQGITWVENGVAIPAATRRFQDLYQLGESTNNLAPVPAAAYRKMKADIQGNASVTMAYAGKVIEHSGDDLKDIGRIAGELGGTANKREDVRMNSRAREKLVELQQLHSMLLAQYVALRSRNVAFRNQTDLSPPQLQRRP